MLLKRLSFVFWSLAALPAGAQQAPAYPQGYFRNPLAIPIVLAGNFGECRPNHFHSGIDIKTLGKENQPVFAAADGYISRVKLDPGGFGHALYVTHPNGYTTLYAHLNDFMPELQQYVRRLQYQQENWELDQELTPDQFPVKKGKQIAWSGNTGGSTAPHLHFEIRDTKTEHPLNPLLFGFTLADDLAPLPKQLALYDLGRSIYEQSPVLLPLKKKGATYGPLRDTLDAPGAWAGLGLFTDDYMNGSENTLAFYTAEWYLDEMLQGRIRLDDIGYDETRYLHAYADYSTKKKKGNWVQCLFQLPGNHLDHIYEELRNESPRGHKGSLHPGDTGVHEARIVLEDAAGNRSEVRFFLRFPAERSYKEYCPEHFMTDRKNTLSNNPNISFQLEEKALYDYICFQFSQQSVPGAYSSVFGLHVPEVPLHQSFELQIKPSKPVPFALRNKIALVYSDGKSESGKAATADKNGWYKASVRTFGSYQLLADEKGPQIWAVPRLTANMSKAKKIAFRVRDEITGVAGVRGELDGRWILFEQHGDMWTYVMDEHCPKGPHELVLRAEDENDNKTEIRFRFTR